MASPHATRRAGALLLVAVILAASARASFAEHSAEAHALAANATGICVAKFQDELEWMAVAVEDLVLNMPENSKADAPVGTLTLHPTASQLEFLYGILYPDAPMQRVNSSFAVSTADPGQCPTVPDVSANYAISCKSGQVIVNQYRPGEDVCSCGHCSAFTKIRSCSTGDVKCASVQCCGGFCEPQPVCYECRLP